MKRQNGITALKFCLLFVFGLLALKGGAQQPGNEELPDSAILAQSPKQPLFSGQIRYYFMATDNAEPMSDYFAHALGGVLKMTSPAFYRFRIGVSGSLAYNLASSDLSVPDPYTSQTNRYEAGLFDLLAPEKKSIKRNEELYLEYKHAATTVTLGRQLINTPFINLQDGRMRPTAVQGVWMRTRLFKNIGAEGGWISRISPRSIAGWHSVASSIGLYPQGMNTNGVRNDYAGHLESKGIALAGFKGTWGRWGFQFWEQFVENIFNTVMLQGLYRIDGDQQHWLLEAQMISQQALGNGGHPDPAKTFFARGGKSLSFGGRAAWKTNLWEASVNYTRITAQGRYLMPREWGKDPFFTFLPRERNDGFGDVHAFVARGERSFEGSRFRVSLAGGYYRLPDVRNSLLNKYGLPSYYQVNADLRYHLPKPLKGVETHFLYVYKGRAGEDYNDDLYTINKVNMSLYNLIFNLNF